MSDPIVAADLFRTVMAAAGGRCTCAGACGSPHAKTEGRCPREHNTYAANRPVRLIAAAADPLTPDRQAAALPGSELRAWCPECFAAARRIARREHAPAPTTDQGGLFDLPAPGQSEGDAA
ncbi:hypothetical protein [Streptomyces sp. NBC_01465]|uniref:hypothetical protein n=1 Tax=Streptomyces sp. NBC_01465 TaxID=2903878 RepID=UPI002E32C99E|nr:hypothetical protein [Streptomyces sp. NBC_01465]